MTAAGVQELLLDAFDDEFGQGSATTYFTKFIETGGPWTFEALSAVTAEATEVRTALPRKHCLRITELAHGVAEWMGGPEGSDKYAFCISCTNAGALAAAASNEAAVLTNESVEPHGTEQGNGEIVSPAGAVTGPSAARVAPTGSNHTAVVTQQGGHATQAALEEITSPLGVTAALHGDKMASVIVAPHRGVAAQVGVQVAPDAALPDCKQRAQQDVQQQEMIRALKHRSFSRAIVGYETQWLAAAVDALARLEDELQLSDIQQHYDQQCAADRELLMREWNRKTMGILSHRKRKLNKKKTKD